MTADEANKRVEQRLKTGGRLVIVSEADWGSIKDLQRQCLERDIAAVMGACPKSG